MSEKIAVILEFNGYTQDELQYYLTLKFGSMTKGEMTASVLSQSGYKKAKAVIFDQPQLNEKQQVVLEWLKQYTLDDSDFKNAICELSKLHIAGVPYKKEEIAFKKLSDSELAEVLAAFAEWGLSNA